MGPYCKFCGRRCFAHLPANAPKEALEAYGSSTIIATCPGGQKFELEKVGWNYDRIINEWTAEQILEREA